MSSAISKFITELKRHGIQDQSRFRVKIYGDDTTNEIPPEMIIGVDLPGPKYEFINCNYWLGNQYFRMPVGVKWEEQLIIQVLTPELEIGMFNWLESYTSNFFYQQNTGKYFGRGTIDSFTYQRQNLGLKIEVTVFDKKDIPLGSYNYGGCFLEKILPTRLQADKAEPQTTSLSFLVGGMYAN